MYLRFPNKSIYFFCVLIILGASFFALAVCPVESCLIGNLMLTPGPSKHATEGSELGVCTRKLQVGGRAKFICSKTSSGLDDEEIAFFFLFAIVVFTDGIFVFLLDTIGRIFLTVGAGEPGFFCPALKTFLSSFSRECPTPFLD